jgi:CRP-like cAMP-binding protein
MPYFATHKLELVSPLTDGERDAVHAACAQQTVFAAGRDLVSDGDRPGFSSVLLEGWACRYRIAGNGKRQIMCFHLPGDWVDIHSYFIRTMDHSVLAITDCRVAQIPHPVVRRLLDGHPRLAQLIWHQTMLDSSVFREWVLNLGARRADERLAHLLCEVRTRLNELGMVNGGAFELPLNQSDLADAIGVSTVHLNRVMQELKKRGLISLGRRTVTISDWQGLVRAGDFDPTYLHLEAGPYTVEPSSEIEPPAGAGRHGQTAPSP